MDVSNSPKVCSGKCGQPANDICNIYSSKCGQSTADCCKIERSKFGQTAAVVLNSPIQHEM
jgi:hypothetical protein